MDYTAKIHQATQLDLLGQGCWGSVYLYQNPDGSQFALKIIPQQVILDLGLGPMLREINHLTKLVGRAHIIQIYGFSFANNEVAIAMEVMTANLKYYPLTPALFNQLITDMTAAITTLNDCNIQHDDIGYHNILYRVTGNDHHGDDQLEFKLADFGDSMPLQGNFNFYHLWLVIDLFLRHQADALEPKWASAQAWLDHHRGDIPDKIVTDHSQLNRDRVEAILQRLDWLAKVTSQVEIQQWRQVVTEIVAALDGQKDHLAASLDQVARVFYSLNGRLI